MFFFRLLLLLVLASSPILAADELQREKGIVFHCSRVEECAAIAWQLAEAKKDTKMKLAIISALPIGDALKTLRELSLENIFDLILKEEKAAPAFYSGICELLQVPSPRCIVFETTLNGVSSAADAGMLALYVSKDKSKDSSQAFYCLRSFSDLSVSELLHAGMEIKISKKDRVLEVFQEGNRIYTFPIGIGLSPIGPKELEGDFKTPEGKYFVCFKNPDSKFHLSLGLNYPNKEDARAGKEKGVITDSQYDRICKAQDQKTPPPWNTALGGEIFIHGNLEDGDGSLGCIRMFEKDIEFLFSITPLGTQVVIEP